MRKANEYPATAFSSHPSKIGSGGKGAAPKGKKGGAVAKANRYPHTAFGSNCK